MQQIHPFAQYLLALAATVLAYAGYAAWVAPRIEGKPPVVEGVSRVLLEIPRDDRTASELGPWLPAGSWELAKCKIMRLRDEDATLYFHDYVTLEDGSVQIYPLTIVLGQRQASSGQKGPLIIRAAEQALVQFDRPLQLGGENPGRLISARMPGAVEIVQSELHAGTILPGLSVRTSNLQLTPQRIFTIEQVEFSQSGSSGAGRNLVIDLAHTTPPGSINNGFHTVNGLARMELAFLDYLELRKPVDPAGEPVVAAGSGADRMEAARVHCRGPLVFDFQDLTARFREEVVVRSTSGSGDLLSGDELQIVFEQVIGTGPPQPVGGAKRPGFPQLKPARIVAVGTPAKLDLPSRTASAVAERLEYDLNQDRIMARDSRAVLVRQAGQEFEAHAIDYRLREDGSLGPMLAEGPGRLTAHSVTVDPGKPARGWQLDFVDRLTIEPDADGKLVTVSGSARVRMQSGEELAGQQIRLWLAQQRNGALAGEPGGDWDYRPRRMEVDGEALISLRGLKGLTRKLIALWSEPVAHAAIRPAGVQAGWVPSFSDPHTLSVRIPGVDRALPSAGIRTVSWSSPADPSSGGASFLGLTPVVAHTVLRPEWNPAGAGGSARQEINLPAADDPIAQPRGAMSFRSDSVTVRLIPGPPGGAAVDQPGSSIELVELEGSVVVEQQELPGAIPAEGPAGGRELLIRSNRLEMRPLEEGLWRAHVHGNAEVETRQMMLRGEDLHLDQAANRMWVAGAGSLELKPQTAVAGGNTPALQVSTGAEQADAMAALESLQVNWAGGMIFDGSRVWFEQGVRSESRHANRKGGYSTIRSLSAGMTLTLDRPIGFREDQGSAGQARVRELLLVAKLPAGQQAFAAPAPSAQADDPAVVLEKSDYDTSGTPQARQLVIVPRVHVDLDTEEIVAEGPGSIGNWQPAGSRGGTPLFAGSKPAATEGSAGAGLSTLHLRFDRKLTAQSARGKLVIDGNVRGVFGSVPGWDDRLDPEPPRPPAGVTRLSCQQVEVHQWTPSGSETALTDLVAAGDAVIRNEAFEARGSRVTYSQQNDLLVLEGDSRSEANLWRSTGSDGSRDHLVAGKISYRPTDQWTHIEKVRSATIDRNGQ